MKDLSELRDMNQRDIMAEQTFETYTQLKIISEKLDKIIEIAKSVNVKKDGKEK